MSKASVVVYREPIEEEWRLIPGFPGYKVSESGRVISNMRKNEVEMQYSRQESGVINVFVLLAGKSKYISVQYLVALAFVPNSKLDPYVFHIDGNKSNNVYTNLRWGKNYDDKIQWKDLTHVSEGYKVSENGDIQTTKRNQAPQLMTLIGINCNPPIHRRAFLKLKDGKQKEYKVCEIVANYFINNPEQYKFIWHLDGEITNNKASNLKWMPHPKEIDPNQIWNPIPGYCKYQISNKGNIISFHNSRVLERKYQDSEGYDTVDITNDEGTRKFGVHQLVALAFIPNPDNLPIVDHIDNKRANNWVENLRWATYSTNSKNLIDTYVQETKPVLQFDMNKIFIKEYENSQTAGEILNIEADKIRRCARGEYRDAGGYIWQYKFKKEKYIPKEGEIFKQIVGTFGTESLNYPNYHISQFGTLIGRNGCRMKPKSGEYPTCKLSHEGEPFWPSIHKLVALFFVAGRTEERCFVNHIDEDKSNYHYKNLEWCTLSENAKHSAHKNYVSVDQIDPVTNKIIATYDSITQAAKAVKLKTGTGISAVLKGRHQLAGKYKWKLHESL